MGGMYNLLSGMNTSAPEILDALGLLPADFRRFRDAFVAEGQIAVYTRLGGGNRASYAETIAKLREHPLYLRDCDDSFDSTYATFWFSVPEGRRARLSALDIGRFDPDARWEAAIASLQKTG